MKAILISIGDELALGQTVDTNAAWLAAQLAALGIPTLLHETIADDRDTIADRIRWACTQAQLLVITGGLGPTADDLTRESLADAMGVALTLDPDSLQRIETFFENLGKPMADRNRVQAMCPDGAAMIPNAAGTAPGIHASLNGAQIFVTPGVPREMKTMFHQHIEPALRQLATPTTPTTPPTTTTAAANTILTTKINTFGSGESDVAETLGPLMDRDRNPTVGTTVADGLCSVRIRSAFADPAQARQQLEDTATQVEAALGPIVFGRDDDTLQHAVVTLLKEQNKTLATAESCTGGLLGAMITDVPGASAAYAGGWVTYANAMKTKQLGVDPGLIETHGAVSEPVARAMADGARQRSGADFALSTTGIAGPDGGTPDKPVGSVWIALASPTGTTAALARLVGHRAAVRDRATKCALQYLRFALLKANPAELGWLKPQA